VQLETGVKRRGRKDGEQLYFKSVTSRWSDRFRGILGGFIGHEFHSAAQPQPKSKITPTALFGVRQLAAALVRMEMFHRP